MCAYKPQVLVVAEGGTGQVTLTNHGILVGAGTTAITQLAAGSAGQVLQSGGASADPSYSTSTFPTTATSTGTILRADGTNWVATTSTYPNTNAVSTLLYASSANVMSALATANTGVLLTNGSGVPAWTTAGTTYSPTVFGSSTAGSTTYSVQQGRYIQIGPLVVYSFQCVGTFGGTAAGNVQTSLPITAATQGNLVQWGHAGLTSVNSVISVAGIQILSAATVGTLVVLSTNSAVAVSASNPFNIQGTIAYLVA